jgi:hypothetical protein
LMLPAPTIFTSLSSAIIAASFPLYTKSRNSF